MNDTAMIQLESLTERFHELAQRIGLGHWTITTHLVDGSGEYEDSVTHMEVDGDCDREEMNVYFYHQVIDSYNGTLDLDTELTHELIHVLLEEAKGSLEPVVHRLAKLLIKLGFAE